MNKTVQTIFVFLVTIMVFHCAEKDSSRIKVPGVVNGDIITVKSKAAGTIISADFSEGKKVKKNGKLMQIDDRIIQNQLSELPLIRESLELKIKELESARRYAQANASYLKKQIKRFKRLLKNRSISGEKLESMELKYKKVQTEIFNFSQKIASLGVDIKKLGNRETYLNLKLEDHLIQSPVDGIIIEKFISNGENIFPAKPVADILDLDTLYVEIFIEGIEMASLKLGDNVKIFLDGIDKSLIGTVSFFGKKAEFSPKYVVSEKERKSLLYLVKIRIDKQQDLFKIGMPVTVVFGTEKKQ